MSRAPQPGCIPDRRPPLGAVISAALICGVLSVIFSISFSALVFGGELARYVDTGVGLALVGTIALSLTIPFLSSYRGTLASLYAEPAIVLGVMASSLAATVAAPALLPTITVAIALSGLLTGIGIYLVGRHDLGKLGQYVPYPVIGGFLAGLGFILAEAAFAFAAPLPQSPFDAIAVADLERWGLVAAVGGVIWAAQHYRPSSYNIPVILGGAILGFWAVAAVVGADIESLRAADWLLGPFPDGGFWHPGELPMALAAADYGALAAEAPKFFIAFFLVLINALMDSSSLELAVRRDVDTNRELKAVGLGNATAGLFGGFQGGMSISSTVLVARMGAGSRLTAALTAMFCAAVFLVGAEAIAAVPRFAVAGLLLYVGVAFMQEWLLATYPRLNRLDYGIILVVFGVVALVGFMEGFTVGIFLGFILFVYTYSRLPVVKYRSDGAALFSNVDRSETDRQFLRVVGAGTHVAGLQGFIFFGTARRLVDLANERLRDTDQPPLDYLILDFKLVDGLDSSAMVVFQKIAQYASNQNFVLILTGCDPASERLLRRYGVLGDQAPHLERFADLDRALEWIEDRRLANRAASDEGKAAIADPIARLFPNPDIRTALLAYFSETTLTEGAYLCQQGDDSDDMFLIQSGEISVYLDLASGERTRVRKFLPGSVVGEIAMLLRIPRSASMVADGPVTVLRLTRDQLEAMRLERPDLLAVLHETLLIITQEKLQDSNRLIAALTS